MPLVERPLQGSVTILKAWAAGPGQLAFEGSMRGRPGQARDNNPMFSHCEGFDRDLQAPRTRKGSRWIVRPKFEVLVSGRCCTFQYCLRHATYAIWCAAMQVAEDRDSIVRLKGSP